MEQKLGFTLRAQRNGWTVNGTVNEWKTPFPVSVPFSAPFWGTERANGKRLWKRFFYFYCACKSLSLNNDFAHRPVTWWSRQWSSWMRAGRKRGWGCGQSKLSCIRGVYMCISWSVNKFIPALEECWDIRSRLCACSLCCMDYRHACSCVHCLFNVLCRSYIFSELYISVCIVNVIAILCIDTGVHCKHGGGRESTHLHWKKDHVSRHVSQCLQRIVLGQ